MRWVLAFVVVICSIGWADARTGVGAQQTWTGVISDSRCGGNHGGEVDERECTTKCIKDGDKFVLATDYGAKVWPIANQDFASLLEHAGHTVKLTGELGPNGIVVSAIKMP
jgi:formylmethanofuran dehydrogenase subunit D